MRSKPSVKFAEQKRSGHDLWRCRRRAVTYLCLALTLLLCGCSNFNREWKRVGRQTLPQDSIAGRWEGRWLSDVNAHTGKLRCIVTGETNGIYAARFRATYLKTLSFSYTVPLQVERRDGDWSFHGEEDLGAIAGGVYSYIGSATATNFQSTYDSKYDRGIFEMQRLSSKQ